MQCIINIIIFWFEFSPRSPLMSTPGVSCALVLKIRMTERGSALLWSTEIVSPDCLIEVLSKACPRTSSVV